MLDETQTAEQKLLARYQALSECVKNNRYPGCLVIAACTFYPCLLYTSLLHQHEILKALVAYQ